MGDGDQNMAIRFYLYVGQQGLSPSTVFFEADDERLARDLCKLFEDEYGVAGDFIFGYAHLADDAFSEEVRICESLDDLRLYDDPDPGVYEPPPSRQTLARAEYARRAQVWANLIHQRRINAHKATVAADRQGTPEVAMNADVQTLETIRRLLEKHRLIFLYFAVPKRVNPLNRESPWETLRDDKFPQIPTEDIDSEGEFLFVHRRKLETFAQAAVGQFGTGLGNKPRTMSESRKVVDVEGGSYPYWTLDETACVYLDESSDTIMQACRDAIRRRADQLISGVLQRIKLALYDEGQTKWYASNLVRWSYLMRLDDALHALKHAEFGHCSEPAEELPASDEGKASRQHDRTAVASEIPNLGDIPPMSEEDDRNSGLLLLMMLAEAYYKMLEATVSMAGWFTALDMDLNHCYLWTIQNLTNLLKNHKYLTDFPGIFEPALPDLYPSTIGDLEWQDNIAPGVEEFLATVQKYVMSKGCYQPEETSPAWIMLELFRPGVSRAFECAQNYHKRMRQAQSRLLGEPLAMKAAQANGTPVPEGATKPIFPTPEGARWMDVCIKVVDGETVAIKLGDHARRYIYSEMGMIDGRTKKPTKQWGLLQLFARNHGMLTWQSSGADRKHQKRREVLSDNLKAFFGIDGEPIVLTDDKKGWRTTFSIHPDT